MRKAGLDTSMINFLVMVLMKDILVKGELPVDFNEKLFHRLVDYATVYPDSRVVFTFRNSAEVGMEI